MKSGYLIFLCLFLPLWLSSCSANEDGSQSKTLALTVTVMTAGDGTPLPSGIDGAPTGTAAVPEQTPGAPQPVDLPEGQVLEFPVLLSEVFGQKVTHAGQNVAEVTGAVIDMVGGQMQYLAVITSSDYGDRTILLPIQSFAVASHTVENGSQEVMSRPSVQLRVTPQVLAAAPAFEPARWANAASLPENWDRQEKGFWADILDEIPVTATEGQEAKPAASPEWIDSSTDEGFSFPAFDRDGSGLGAIDNLLLGQEGQVLFLLLQTEVADGPDAAWIPIAWKSVAWSQPDKAYIFQVSADTLDQAPRVEPGTLPDTSVPGWDEEWQQYWEQHGPGAVPAETPVTEAGLQATTLSALQQRPVRSIDETMVGQVADWVVSTEGESQFAILQLDQGFVPVPWRLLDWQSQDEPVRLLQETGVVLNAPVFEKLEILNSEQNWQTLAADYWSGYIDMENEALLPDMALLRAGTWIGESVLGPEGGTLGAVEDLIILPEGQPPYLLLQSRNRYLAVPWIYFSYKEDTQQMVYLDDLRRLRDAPGVSDPADLIFSNPVWDKAIRSYWGM